MRFMMLIYPGPHAEAGTFPPDAPELFAAMGRYNEELAKAGALLAMEGLQPTSKGARVRFTGGKPTVTDGPFTETKEIIGGFWLIDVRSREEAIEWARRAPCPPGETIEVRQVYAAEDFPADAVTQEVLEKERALREAVATKK